MTDIRDQNRLGVLFLTGQTNRIPTRARGTQSSGIIRTQNEGVLVGIGQVELYRSLRVHIAKKRRKTCRPDERFSPHAAVKDHTYLTRPSVGSGMATASNPS
jgi:hypothetical protein